MNHDFWNLIQALGSRSFNRFLTTSHPEETELLYGTGGVAVGSYVTP